MVINQTEALVSIDINSGKATREHNIEDTALKTNLEASEEVARQLRLRDLAGLIVIDFIDMEEKRNNRAVERRLKEALKHDRARIQVGRISHFGLLEMSRQRLRPSLLEGSTKVCPHCDGRGIVRSISSCALTVLRMVEEYLMSKKAENLTVKCHPEVAFYILNDKRDHLLNLEAAYGVSIFISPSGEVKTSQAVIERGGERQVQIRKPQAVPVKIDSAFAEEEEAEAEGGVEAEEPEEAEAAAGAEPSDDREERDDERRGRRRRRGRRGGRRGERGSSARPTVEEDEGGEAPEATAGHGGATDAAETAPPEDYEEPAEAGEEERRAENGQGRSRGRGRRDRWGRERQRRSRAPEEAASRGEEAAGHGAEERPAPARNVEAEPPAPTAAAAVVQADIELVTPPEPEPRKWQPPAPTVTVPAGERKAGWWSRKS
jgi:ribonuclease E